MSTVLGGPTVRVPTQNTFGEEQLLDQLGQVTPAAATPTTLYTLPVDTQVSISQILITNLNAGAANVKIYQDRDGASTTNTAIYANAALGAGSSVVLSDLSIFLSTQGGTVIVESDVVSVTFTVYGAIKTQVG